MAKRQAISPKLRFEVLKQARFRCQYCGASQADPDVVLHIDHLKPVAEGGTNDLLNLVAACAVCNLGKGRRLLDDDSVLRQARSSLEEIQHRRDNLQLMAKWLDECRHELEDSVSLAWNSWLDWSRCPELPEEIVRTCRQELQRLIQKFGAAEVLRSVYIVVQKYVHYDSKGRPDVNSLACSWDKLGGVCSNRSAQRRDTDESRLKYIRGILKNRFGSGVYEVALPVIRVAASQGLAIERIEAAAKLACSWKQFREFLAEKPGELPH